MTRWFPFVRPATVPVAIALSSAVLIACQNEEGDNDAEAMAMVDTAAEAEAIMALDREWSSAAEEGDLESVMSIHAADAIQMPPNAAPVVGAEALRAAWEGMINTDGLSVSWEPTAAFVSASGDMAWDYGTATLTSPDGTTTPMKYLVVWKRENGEWKVAADIFNANVPPQ
jgi:ketosteroid isomerase-like protein